MAFALRFFSKGRKKSISQYNRKAVTAAAAPIFIWETDDDQDNLSGVGTLAFKFSQKENLVF